MKTARAIRGGQLMNLNGMNPHPSAIYQLLSSGFLQKLIGFLSQQKN